MTAQCAPLRERAAIRLTKTGVSPRRLRLFQILTMERAFSPYMLNCLNPGAAPQAGIADPCPRFCDHHGKKTSGMGLPDAYGIAARLQRSSDRKAASGRWVHRTRTKRQRNQACGSAKGAFHISLGRSPRILSQRAKGLKARSITGFGTNPFHQGIGSAHVSARAASESVS
jgi:hypothetical protein